MAACCSAAAVAPSNDSWLRRACRCRSPPRVPCVVTRGCGTRCTPGCGAAVGRATYLEARSSRGCMRRVRLTPIPTPSAIDWMCQRLAATAAAALRRDVAGACGRRRDTTGHKRRLSQPSRALVCAAYARTPSGHPAHVLGAECAAHGVNGWSCIGVGVSGRSTLCTSAAMPCKRWVCTAPCTSSSRLSRFWCPRTRVLAPTCARAHAASFLQLRLARAAARPGLWRLGTGAVRRLCSLWLTAFLLGRNSVHALCVPAAMQYCVVRVRAWALCSRL